MHFLSDDLLTFHYTNRVGDDQICDKVSPTCRRLNKLWAICKQWKRPKYSHLVLLNADCYGVFLTILASSVWCNKCNNNQVMQTNSSAVSTAICLQG